MTGKEIVDQSRSSDCGHDETHCAVVCETCCANAIDDAFAAEREACCRDMCKLCLRGNLATHTTGDKHWIHFVNDGLQAKGTDGRVVVCGASSIRLRRM
jgi:hypothetical protein